VVVYVDLIFFVNFAIDGALLLATAWTRRIKVKVWRVALGSGIGAAYVILMLFPDMSFFFTFLMKIAFSIFMLLASFGFGQLQRFIRLFSAFYLVNFVAAGGMLAIHYLMLSSNGVMNSMWYTHTGGLTFTFQVSLGFILCTLCFILWSYMRFIRGKEKQQHTAGSMANVTIHVDEFTYSCVGLVDTGNQLYDPLTQLPVMIVEVAAWKNYLPDSWLRHIYNGEVEKIITAANSFKFIGQERLRLIPYRGIQQSNAFMLAIKPDQVMICLNQTQVTSCKVLIGFIGGHLSSDHAYQAIIHPALTEAVN